MSEVPVPAVVLAVACMLLSGRATAADQPTGGFECQQLAQRAVPDSPSGWLERSLWASHCYVFQARAVRISSDGVRTLALSHDIRDGVEHEAASYLDGPPVVYERHGRIVRDSLPEFGASRASPAAILSRMDGHYRLSLDGESRIAGRHCIRLDIEPLDNLRYGHQLWLDRATGLPLKQTMVGVDGRVIETFQMTDLGEPRLYSKAVDFISPPTTPPESWQPGWLPSGYQALALPQVASVASLPLGQRLYSDGLASFSLFIEPLQNRDHALLPGLHRLGVSYAAVRHLSMGERIFQVVVMGEVPPDVLQRVAARVDYRPSQAGTTSATP